MRAVSSLLKVFLNAAEEFKVSAADKSNYSKIEYLLKLI